MFLYKSFFFNIFYSFNPNHAYWNQRRLFAGNLPGMFEKILWEIEDFRKDRALKIAQINSESVKLNAEKFTSV